MSSRLSVLAAAFLGIAVGATLLSWYMAGANFAVVDFERNDKLGVLFAPIEGDDARKMAVRYIANESNRSMFKFFGPLQVAFAVAGVLVGRKSLASLPSAFCRRLSSGLLAVVLVTSIGAASLVPTIVQQGRNIDFEPRTEGERSPAVERFYFYHVLYVGADSVKLLAAVTLIGLLAAVPASSRQQ